MVALRASRLVWSATSRITETTEVICREASPRCSIRLAVSVTACSMVAIWLTAAREASRPWPASSRVSCMLASALRALSLRMLMLTASSSTPAAIADAALLWVAALSARVREIRDRAVAVPSTSRACWRSSPIRWPMLAVVASMLRAITASSLRVSPSASSCSMRTCRSPAPICSRAPTMRRTGRSWRVMKAYSRAASSSAAAPEASRIMLRRAVLAEVKSAT